MRGVDRLNQRISCYTFARKSRRNWLRLFIFFFNASIANLFICYSQLAQTELSYLNYLVLLAKSLCSGTERINLGRLSLDKKRNLASPTPAVQFDGKIHLPLNGTRRRCAYCSTKEVQVRSNIERFTCKLAFCVKDDKNCFFEYRQVLREDFESD
jgi:hypothetical protein